MTSSNVLATKVNVARVFQLETDLRQTWDRLGTDLGQNHPQNPDYQTNRLETELVTSSHILGTDQLS